MNKVYEFIVKEYGYDEPVFTKELRNQIDMSSEALRQNLKRLADNGNLIKVKPGIYYVPKVNSILKRPVMNLDKVVARKYIKPVNEEVIGYTAGINFANQLGITTQTASVMTIITNKTGRYETEVTYGNKVVKLKKPKALVNQKNYKVLQIVRTRKPTASGVG